MGILCNFEVTGLRGNGLNSERSNCMMPEIVEDGEVVSVIREL